MWPMRGAWPPWIRHWVGGRSIKNEMPDKIFHFATPLDCAI